VFTNEKVYFLFKNNYVFIKTQNINNLPSFSSR